MTLESVPGGEVILGTPCSIARDKQSVPVLEGRQPGCTNRYNGM
jgi:hypothetical protein